ncbi:hypothetical protein TWF225_011871 [Orbilia oligospora]|uniref:Uncharacterized protein n=1 Tax=Orbilia oligospora TaxID=2813651 RepID=A0A7C8KDD5_ORBOL|nr:hypothetical protein TWF751_011803 [Orbilia oligospora]KAF3167954.1 hypothetical protein TWF225_011871 [Orbilia oligospora]KAF3234028.1 hypothetical protein TWF128_002637 [Orbilia oligospora]KAF3254978.1 hypothetical protein TWF217_006681 [Orbilia oligospora]KAF3280721.1 hypothetical protein TWF132_011469 [Orbilia oligospora]
MVKLEEVADAALLDRKFFGKKMDPKFLTRLVEKSRLSEPATHKTTHPSQTGQPRGAATRQRRRKSTEPRSRAKAPKGRNGLQTCPGSGILDNNKTNVASGCHGFFWVVLQELEFRLESGDLRRTYKGWSVLWLHAVLKSQNQQRQRILQNQKPQSSIIQYNLKD